MSNSYTKIYLHYVFAPKHRLSLHDKSHRDDLLSYISGIIKNNNCHLYRGNVMPDHVHLLIGLHPSVSIADMAREVKANSSRYINEKHWVPGKFSWQDGYGAFSCSHNVIDKVIKYIDNQETHHKTRSFLDEFKEFMKISGIPVDQYFHVYEPTKGNNE